MAGLLGPDRDVARREGKLVIVLEAAEASLPKVKSSVIHDLVKERFFSPFLRAWCSAWGG